MKAYAIGSILHADRISHVHYRLFHGEETVDTRWSRFKDPSLVGTAPLCLIRNARNVPLVFAPSAGLVICENAKKSLETFPHVRLFPVRFAKVVDFPVPAPGDFSFEDTPQFKRLVAEVGYEDFLDGLADVPELHQSLGLYYELLVPRLCDVAARYSSYKHVVCEMPTAAGSQKQILTLSPEILTDYPITQWGYDVFNEEAFARIKAYLDWDYFEVVELEV
jgi:hypothetical protein